MNTKALRIAFISEHPSPLTALGDVDADENVYVDHAAQGLAAAGHEVDMLTRRGGTGMPAVTHRWRGARVLHIEAGP